MPIAKTTKRLYWQIGWKIAWSRRQENSSYKRKSVFALRTIFATRLFFIHIYRFVFICVVYVFCCANKRNSIALNYLSISVSVANCVINWVIICLNMLSIKLQTGWINGDWIRMIRCLFIDFCGCVFLFWHLLQSFHVRFRRC